MKVSYDKLWKLLIDKKIKKTELIQLTHMGSATMAKLGKNEYVNMEVLARICKSLKCNLEDICQFVEE